MREFKENLPANSGVQARLMCFVCEKQIADDGWFCRLPQKTEGAADAQAQKVLLCSPTCALRYLGDSQPSGNGFESSYDGFEHSLPVTGGGQKNGKLAKPRAPKTAENNND